jgi:CO/xanthine dehydrogenase FAD-binding subunit
LEKTIWEKKMSKFCYIRPDKLEDALLLMQEPAYINTALAGGTDLLVSLRNSAQQFQRLVDISRLDELKIIQQNENTVSLGAGVTFREILDSEILQQAAPLLITACSMIGGPQIRNRGTVGGNVANAAVCADSLPVLVCLDSIVHLRSLNSTRHMPVTDFVSGYHQTQIQPGEILTHFTFEILPHGVRSVFIKLGRRNAQTISRLSIAVLGRTGGDGKVELVRIVPGAAVPWTKRFVRAEEILLNELPTLELITCCGRMVADEMVAETGRRWSTEFKEPVIARLTERALAQVLID